MMLVVSVIVLSIMALVRLSKVVLRLFREREGARSLSAQFALRR